MLRTQHQQQGSNQLFGNGHYATNDHTSMWPTHGHNPQQGGGPGQQHGVQQHGGNGGFPGLANIASSHAQLAAAASNAQQNHYNRIAASHAHAGSGAGGAVGQGVGGGQGNGGMGQGGQQQNGQSHGGDVNSVADAAGLGTQTEENKKVLGWVAELLSNNGNKETALMELSKKREQVPELALIIWHSFGECTYTPLGVMNCRDTLSVNATLTIYFTGVMTSLLQEIISVYPLLNPSQLTAAASNRVCNALALLQCVASHTETRGLFLSGRLQIRRLDGCTY